METKVRPDLIKKIVLFEKIKKYIDKVGNPEFYWHYDSRISDEQIEKLITNTGDYDLYQDISEQNMDYTWEIEDEFIKEIHLEFEDTIDSISWEEYEFREAMYELFYVEMNIDQLLRNTRSVPIRVSMYSDYDCINSNGFNGSKYWYEESYFKDMVDCLNLNPKKIKESFLDHKITPAGRWPDLKRRNGKELVSYKSFSEEIIESCTAANLLTFMGRIDVNDVSDINGQISKIIIPKGNRCGLFSTMYGGGSQMEMELLQDFEIDLNGSLNLMLDATNKYSISDTYGVRDDFFGKNVRIINTGEKKEK